MMALTLTGPLAIAARRSGRKTCGMAKDTKIGSTWLMVASTRGHGVVGDAHVVPALFGIEPMRPDTGARISV